MSPLAHLRGVVHRYYLSPIEPRTLNSDTWSLWLLDQTTCSLAIVSDYGNWAHCWGRSGVTHADWRVEFLNSSADYLRGKLASGVPKTFDLDATNKAISKAYWDLMGEGDLCKDEDLEAAFSDIDSEFDFGKFVEDHEEGWRFADCAKYSTHEAGWLDHLMTVTLPRVRAIIQAELDAEARAA